MYRAIIVAMFVRFALAQIVTLPEQLPKAVGDFGPGAASGELPCAVEELQPVLNFASRFQAGYVVRAPMNAYPGGGHHWDVVFRVTPQEGSGQPVLFTDSIDLPDDASSDAIEEMHGVFLLGEGQYHVKWSMLDDLGRVFRKEWDLEAKATGKERITMPSGMAGDLAWRSASETPVSAYPQRVTLLVNVSRTAGYPWTTLLAVLEPLVERLSTASVRLVVFDLPKQRQLFREDGFALNGMNRLVHATNWLTGRVDPGPFEHQAGVWDLLAKLVNGEIQSPEPADAVVFIGAPWWIKEAMPAGFPKPDKGMTPRFFSVHYSNANASRIGPHGAGGWQGDMGMHGGPPPAAAQAQMPGPSPGEAASTLFDTIKQTVLRMKGKIFVIQTPADLSKAIEEIDRRVE
jgi:hypothetical protein